MDAVEFPIQLDPNGPDAIVVAKIEFSEKIFAIGDHIRFTPDELLGTCLFYQLVIYRVSEAA